MASFGGYPQTVNFQTVNVAKGGGSANLLVNPRGLVNQLGEADGIVAAGVYFCDGWKAGADGAEVYVDSDGIRLISGSIVQLVPNTLEAGRQIRSNMDVLNGSPVMSIDGATDNELNGTGEYITFEISGDNSKFTRIILAESVEIPIYQQVIDELTPCKRFCQQIHVDERVDDTGLVAVDGISKKIMLPVEMVSVPAFYDLVGAGTQSSSDNDVGTSYMRWRYAPVSQLGWESLLSFTRILDARP